MGTKERSPFPANAQGPQEGPQEGPQDAGPQGKAKRVRRPAKSSHPGRESQVTTPQAKFVADWMERKHLHVTRAQIAKRVGMSSAFVTRYFNSTDPTAFREHLSVHEAVCAYLGFDAQARREYLAIWGLEVGTPSALPRMEYHGVDVEQQEEYISRLEDKLTKRSTGELELLIRELSREEDNRKSLTSAVQEIYDDLKELPHSVRVAEARLRAGLFLAAVQEVALPWQPGQLEEPPPSSQSERRPTHSTKARVRTRSQIALTTYDDLLVSVFPHLPLSRYPDEYLQVLVRRIVLKREGKEGTDALASVADLRVPEQANMIDALIPRVSDPRVVVAYQCQLLHTLAVAGRVNAWEKRLLAVEDFVRGLKETGALGEELDAIVRYTEGVGYKRFMWLMRTVRDPKQRAKAEQKQQDLAKRSVETLSSLQKRATTEQSVYNINLYHPGLPRVLAADELQASILDSQLWTDETGASNALAQALLMRARIAQSYPSLASKLDAQIALATQRLGLASGHHGRPVR